jgi:TPP-dependent pyruvate/acetoin dehydrogenase alpha subunit
MTDELPDLEQMYEVMQTITVADRRAEAEVRSGAVQATLYPVHGLEGVCAALGAALRRSDQLVSTYRNLGDAIAKGAPLGPVIAEACGKVGGSSKGKGGPMHIQDLDAGLIVTSGIVGGAIPIAVGLALAAQLDGDGRVVAVTFGDGATSIGAYHEAMNMASLWKLPIVFVCQNNGWAEHTPIAEYAPVTDLAGRAASYGVTATAVDGFDPIATWRVLCTAVENARGYRGPQFVECQTYRLAGHSGAADYSYMPTEEFEAAAKRDPAPSFRAWLLATGQVDEARLAEIDARAQATVDAAFVFAAESPEPSADELYTDVYG